jgi:hypothetical protein
VRGIAVLIKVIYLDASAGEVDSNVLDDNYALRFFTNSKGVDFWIHGRDLPGYPASHGCIGLYDEEMQKKYYKYPRKPLLEEAKTLYQWVVDPSKDDNGYTILNNGPKILIIGHAPLEGPECAL